MIVISFQYPEHIKSVLVPDTSLLSMDRLLHPHERGWRRLSPNLDIFSLPYTVNIILPNFFLPQDKNIYLKEIQIIYRKLSNQLTFVPGLFPAKRTET
jgi:hypothetical protein